MSRKRNNLGNLAKWKKYRPLKEKAIEEFTKYLDEYISKE